MGSLAKTYFDVGTYTGQGNYQRIGIPTKRNASTLQVSRSLRFRAANTAYLSRTPASATNRTTWTWSGWIKIGNSSGTYRIFDSFLGGSEESGIVYNKSANEFRFEYYNGTSYTTQCVTSAAFKDPSVWYHLVLAVDTTQATSTNRILIYVNNLLQTLSTATYPSQNAQFAQNSTNAHYISRLAKSASNYFDGYLSEVVFVDGQALTPSSFGVYNSDNIWVPQTYSGTYGTNGFYLPFSDNSALTTASNVGIGKDFSGNTNYWITNSISLTSGVTYDSMIDTPTDAASATQPVSNYAVMNPKDSLNGTTSNGSLSWTASTSQSDIRATLAIPSSGAWYMECIVSTTTSASVAASFGLATSSVSLSSSNPTSGVYQLYGTSSGYLSLNGTNANSSLGIFTAGDVLQIAVDTTNTKMWLGKNNTWFNSTGGTSGSPSTGANPTSTDSMIGLFPFSNCYSNRVDWNFGQRPFTYTPPTGFSALCTSNITAPVDASKWFYGGSPDFVWIKDRTSAYSHSMNDSVRGWELTVKSDASVGEVSAPDISDVNKFGITLIGDTNYRVNKASDNYVYWAWKAGGSSPTTIAVNQYSANTPNIASNVSVSTTSGFSIVTYTYDSSRTNVIGHGLGVAPSLILQRDRTSTSYNWDVYHTSLGYTQRLLLNSTSAAIASYWAAAPTSQVFSVSSATYTNGDPIVAYCFAAIPGFSAFGSYTGNGSADGPFVYCGFRVRWLMIKRTDSASVTYGWQLYDTSRQPYNTSASDPNLWADASAAEGTGNYTFDLLSNGFKLRSSGVNENASGGTYIYAAFAENPFNYSLAR